MNNEAADKTIVEKFEDSLRKYLVRRLTPTECGRLQGFADGWADIPKTTDMSDKDIEFWRSVYLTHKAINSIKPNRTILERGPRLKIQLIKWYNKLHNDGAEYKMWGNGMAAPNAKFVISRACEHLRTLPSYNGTITLGSMFDGSGTMPMCIEHEHDGRAVWASEVEPYPIAVTRHNMPHMEHLGSVADFRGGNIPPVDIITFGSPCQDVSVAGKRKGMKHEDKGDSETTRSGLFFTAIDRISEMLVVTNGQYPKIVIWENVPGAFSSNGGEDFECVLNELLHLGCADEFIRQHGKWNKYGDYGAVAYRTVDAKFWGVPQRRRRIYAISDITGECAGEILFEPLGMSWHFTPCEKKGHETARAAEDSARVPDSVGGATLHPSSGRDTVGTLLANCGTLNTVDRHAVAYATEPCGFIHSTPSTAGGIGYAEGLSPTLRAGNQPAIIAALQQPDTTLFEAYQHHGYRTSHIAGTITAEQNQRIRGDTPIIMYDSHPQDSRITECIDIAHTVSATYGTGGGNTPLVLHNN